MPVDIEQWCTEIGSFNGHFLGVIMKLELNLLNIISSLNQVLALICALVFQYISNVDTAFYFFNNIFCICFVNCCLEIHSLQSFSLFFFCFFLTGIHPMQGWTATTRHRVTRREAQKGLQDTENLFRKSLQLKDVC